jgi:lactoylglutathione lyase
MFVHTSIRTSNLERAIDFYNDFLGLKLKNRREIPQNNAEIAFLQDPEGKGATLELTFYRNQKNFIHLAFEVKNIAKTIHELRKKGIAITDEPFQLSPNGPLIAFVEDPDGTLIELIQR